MSKIYVSYFYQVRFFDPSIIPVSTAIWDPKWYHDFKDESYIYKDENGVLNGIKFLDLSPLGIDSECPECKRSGDPNTCSFITKYYNKLESLDFDKVLAGLNYIKESSRRALGLVELPSICLMVHEAPDNPCSERDPLIKYFRSHGMEVEEWQKKK